MNDWRDVLPLLAERVAADTDRDVAEVTATLDRAYRSPADEVDVDELVELLAPTLTAIIGPVLLDVLRRLEEVSEDGPPVMAPIVLPVMAGMVAGVMAAEEVAARGA